MDTVYEDDDDCEINLDEREEMVPLDTFIDEWQPGNPDQFMELPFTRTTGLQEDIGDTPISYFNALCNDELLSLLTRSTNEYGEREKATSRSAQSRARFWKPVSCSDIKLFFGLLFHMGFIKINRLSDYWKTDTFFNQPIFAKAMSRNTFLLILRMLCVNVGGTTSNCKIKPIIDYFNKRMLEIYYPTKAIVIDESMMLWRGRLRIRQYMKGKKNKYGLKFYALADQLGVVLKLHLYGGATDTLVGGTNHVKKVVKHLMDAYINAGHHLFMDNFYTSVDLVDELYYKDTYCTGTLRKMRKSNPKTVLNTKLKKGELCIQHKNNICVIKWMD
ncbi:piggyBac transposable element-derived protein 4-like [Trichoplusia ni]|uniref:PiggyBac transposable element-derived protein 4-like n=1 Tax=Trichoplusia ni TaxID=7111 RepID=A0A7E5WV79_TRINI|nr:piggyBac transposable element-derived protein 4-like [Trichoplusia ni]